MFFSYASLRQKQQDDNFATNYINSLLLIVEILWDTSTRFVFKLLTDVLGHPFTSFFVS